MVTPPGGALAPVDTVAVHGGTGASAVDLDSVRRSAALIGGAAADLRAAAVRCLGVSGDLAVPGAGRAEAAGWIPAEAAARARVLEAAAQDIARGLAVSADLCELLGWRLLRAAGLYEEAESTAERVVGALVTAGSFGMGAAFGSLGWAGLAGIGVLGGAGVAAHLAGGALTGGVSGAATGRIATVATRGAAPFSDEAFTGMGSGVALVRPGLAQGRAGVGGGAGVLTHVARELPVLGNDDDGARVRRLGPEDFAGGSVPAWSGTGARSVQEALTRVDSLYPEQGGAPSATLAVQRVTGVDGTVSWTVLIPGTQSALPAEHPWDGRTDVELVAGRPDAATMAVERALAESGVGPDEPVTFVGHSLGGIAAAALVSRAGFAERYRVGGLVTAGSPTGLLATPPGVPVLHLETPEELVSHADGRSASENPRTPDRVTVVRSLRDSADAGDRVASGDVAQAHAVATHVRTLDLALDLGDPRVAEVADRIGAGLDGATVSTRFYRAERAGAERTGAG
ncbi:alpha/beta fold hydrolase [Promicromonospora xylanilytica]